MSEFWAMGGYGAYVWTAYGVTALALALLFIWSWLGARAREAELAQVRALSRGGDRRGVAEATLHDDTSRAASTTGPITAGDAGQAGS